MMEAVDGGMERGRKGCKRTDGVVWNGEWVGR